MATRMHTYSRFRVAMLLVTALTLVLSQGVIPAQGTWSSMVEPTLVSRSFDGAPTDGGSWGPNMSDDGRYIVYESDANNITDNDNGPNGQGEKDVFRFDRTTGETELISVRSEVPTWTADRGSRSPCITDDGRYVLFITGNQYVEEDTNDETDMYVKDMETGEFRYIDFWGNGSSSMDNCFEHYSISGDGSFFVFEVDHGDILGTGKVGASTQIWGYDLESDEATLVSAPPDPSAYASRGSRDPAISDDGRYVAFLTGNGWSIDDENGEQDIYVRDMETGEMRFVDFFGTGDALLNENWDIRISGDGNRIVFTSDYQLLPGDDTPSGNSGDRSVYSYDLESEEATLVSGPEVSQRGSRDPSVTDDGNTVLFQTGQSFDPADPNGEQDLYLKDMTTGEFSRVPVLGDEALPGDDIWDEVISADGEIIAFSSGPDLSRLDTNGYQDVYYTTPESTVLSEGPVRLSGSTRYTTAVDVSMQAFPRGSDTVVVATGEDWPDALGGSTLAGAVDGPMLLTNSDHLTSEVAAEIVRLGAHNVYLLGGYGAVSPTVEIQLEILVDGYVWRIGGPDRYATSKAVANEAIRVLGAEYDGKACVTTGMNFPDAVAAAPLGAGLGWPILLVRPTDPEVLLPPTTDSAVVLGGTKAVAPEVETYLNGELGDAAVDRVGGATRYETSAMAAQYGVDHGLLWNGVGITSGINYPDALTGGVACGLYRTTMLLTTPTTLHPAAEAALTDNAASIEDVTFMGGGAAVSTTVENQVKAILGL